MTTRIVAVLNQKGGVGKTTTSVNLTHALARLGNKVSVIDLDPQSHLSVSLGMLTRQRSGIDDVMLGNKLLDEQIIAIRDNLQLIPAGPRLQEIEALQVGGAERGNLLRTALQQGLPDQDFIFIDCPPSSSILVANALLATDEILVPMTSDYLALQGLSHLLGTIKKFESVLNKRYNLRLIMSRYVATRKLSLAVLGKIRGYFPKQVLATSIRETAALAECPSFGKTIFEYRPRSRAARDFNELANDFLLDRVM